METYNIDSPILKKMFLDWLIENVSADENAKKEFITGLLATELTFPIKEVKFELLKTENDIQKTQIILTLDVCHVFKQ